MDLITKPLPDSEAAVHFVLIQMLLLWKCESEHYPKKLNCSLAAKPLPGDEAAVDFVLMQTVAALEM